MISLPLVAPEVLLPVLLVLVEAPWMPELQASRRLPPPDDGRANAGRAGTGYAGKRRDLSLCELCSGRAEWPVPRSSLFR